MSDATFSISTYLFHRQRLDREHLVEVAAHGFGGVEIFALPSHLPVDDPAAVSQLGEWLDDTRLVLTSVHVTADGGVDGDGGGPPCSLASGDEAVRERALARARSALDLSKILPYRYLVLDVGVPEAEAGPGDNDASAARRSLDGLCGHAAERGVQLALRMLPNRLSTAEALVSIIEEVLEDPGVGICVDVANARLLGDPVDAIEWTSGHILIAHVHDTHGSRAEHLVPYDGSIDWTRALLAFQKVGFHGPWTFELAPTTTPIATLTAAAHARRRFEQRLGLNDELLSL